MFKRFKNWWEGLHQAEKVQYVVAGAAVASTAVVGFMAVSDIRSKRFNKNLALERIQMDRENSALLRWRLGLEDLEQQEALEELAQETTV